MMDDIIVRLLENKDEWGAKCWQCGEVDGHYEGCLMVDAADEIKQLRREVSQLQGVVRADESMEARRG